MEPDQAGARTATAGRALGPTNRGELGRARFWGPLGRAVAGPWVGLTAAGLAAVVPDFWIPNGIIMSETPAMLLTALVLLAVVRLLRSPDLWSAALVGAACGALALTRAELVLFLPALLIPAVLAARSSSIRRKLALLGTGAVVACLVMAPWVGRNLASFPDTTTFSTGEGLALLGANCPQTYSGAYLGSWSLQCSLGPRPGGDESVVSARDQHLALQFAEHHARRLPSSCWPGSVGCGTSTSPSRRRTSRAPRGDRYRPPWPVWPSTT